MRSIGDVRIGLQVRRFFNQDIIVGSQRLVSEGVGTQLSLDVECAIFLKPRLMIPYNVESSDIRLVAESC